MYSAWCDSYFMYTGPGRTSSVNIDVARNTTQLLDQLLNGYDSRLRPGFGGKSMKLKEYVAGLIGLYRNNG